MSPWPTCPLFTLFLERSELCAPKIRWSGLYNTAKFLGHLLPAEGPFWPSSSYLREAPWQILPERRLSVLCGVLPPLKLSGTGHLNSSFSLKKKKKKFYFTSAPFTTQFYMYLFCFKDMCALLDYKHRESRDVSELLPTIFPG